MRLIRLTTEENDGRFDCDFNEDLVIPPNSQIALHSFTTQFPFTSIVIDSTNNVIRYTVNGGDNIKTIVMPEGTYSNANIQEFFSQVQQRLNKSIAFETNQLGKQWRAGIFSGKTEFTIKRGFFRTIPITLNTNNCSSKNVANVSNNPATQGDKYQRLGGTVGSNDSFMFWNIPIVKSAGYFSQRLIVDSTVPTNGGFIMGLTSVCPDANTTIINPSTLQYGIRFNGVGQPYSEITNGVTTQTTTLGALNDRAELSWVDGNMRYRVIRDTGETEIIVSSTIYNHITNYFPVVVYVGDCILGQSNMICDPFYTVPTSDDMIPTEPEPLEGRFYPPQKSDNFFEFNTVSVAEAFGFNFNRIPQSGFINTISYSYLGERPFGLRDYSDTYIVELLNIQLNSMDAMTKQHKNFLAIVPHLQELRELVVYVAPMLIFLDLNNKFPLSYRQIKARILRDDLTPVITYGLSQMAILIKSYDE